MIFRSAITGVRRGVRWANLPSQRAEREGRTITALVFVPGFCKYSIGPSIVPVRMRQLTIPALSIAPTGTNYSARCRT